MLNKDLNDERTATQPKLIGVYKAWFQQKDNILIDFTFINR